MVSTMESQRSLKNSTTGLDNEASKSDVNIYRNTSDFTFDNRTSNITRVQSNVSLENKLPKGITQDNKIDTPSLSAYKVTVVFDSITVHDDHEGLLSGDGEYDLDAYVQGVKISLTDASIPPGVVYTATKSTPPFGLGDISEGETVHFNPGTEITLYLPVTTPLSIFTRGFELDDCAYKRPRDEPLKDLLEMFKNPQLDWYTLITQYVAKENSKRCGFDNYDDVLGNIVKFYNPPGRSYEPVGWGAGSHTNVVSDTGDYTLRYTINVTSPPTLAEKQIDSSKFSNKFESNNNTITFGN
jgi:hypothetical protein